MKLLKAKALSTLWQYPGCPIIQSYAKYLLRITHKIKANFSENDIYHINHVDIVDDNTLNFEEQLNRTPYKVVALSTRLLMEKIFKLDVTSQLSLEYYFENKNDLDDYSFDFSHHVHKDVTDFYARHVFTIPDDIPVHTLKHAPINCVNSKQKAFILKLLKQNMSKSVRKRFTSLINSA